MNYLKTISLLLLVSFLTGCPPPSQAPAPVSPIERNYEARRQDSDRRNVLKDSRERYRGGTCEQEDRDHQCKEDCRDIYSRRGDREDCEKLPVTQIDELIKIHKLLEDPDEEDLKNDVAHEDFKVYVKVSIAPLDRLIGKYNSRKAKELMKWMMENNDIAKVFRKEDDDYKAFERLLKEIRSFSGDDQIHVPFTSKIDGSDKLMEVAIDVGGEEVLEWFHDYINEKHSDCEDEASSGCFAVYCKIGDGIDNDSAENWVNFKTFQGYIDDIIEEEVNGDAWAPSSKRPGESDPYEDNRDLDDWVGNLCSGLTS